MTSVVPSAGQSLSDKGSSGQVPDPPSSRLTVVRCAPDELRAHRGAWQRLVEMAIEANVFFEPGMLLPAIEHRFDSSLAEIVLVYAEPSKPGGDPVLTGLFPVTDRIRYRERPSWGSGIWLHAHCFFGVPLVRRERALETVRCFLDWLATERRNRLFYWPVLHVGGAFHQTLVRVLQERQLPWFVQRQYARATLEANRSRASAANRYELSGRMLGKTNRTLRQLAKLGEVAVRLTPTDPAKHADEFLKLETKGWKGAKGHPLASSDEERRFLHDIMSYAFAQGTLQFAELRLDDELIATYIGFRTGDGSFAFKTAFDEGYAKYSIGRCIISKFSEDFVQGTGGAWCDSCSMTGHALMDSLWPSRRLMQHVWTGTRSSWMGELGLMGLSAGSSLEVGVRSQFRDAYRAWKKKG